jgi:peptidoglycan/LPS O-acetylase OafA/YrhL
MNSQQPYDRSAAIDLLRGALAILVLSAHGYDIAKLSSPLGATWQRILDNTLARGNYWVTGFFVLSGYCIELSCRKIDRATTNRKNEEYLLARATRLAPLYYSGLLLALVIEGSFCLGLHRPRYWMSGIDSRCLIAQIIGATAVTPSTFGSSAPSGTVAMELVYYLLWVVGRFRVRGNVKLYLRASFIGTFICLTAPAFAFHRAEQSSQIAHNIFLLFWNYNAWLMGAALATESRLFLLSGRVAKFWWIGLLVEGVLEAFTSIPTTSRPLLLGPSFVLLLIQANNWHFHGRGKELCEWLGNLSYPLYLFHGPLLMFVAGIIETVHLTLSFTSEILILIVVVMVIVGIAGVPAEGSSLRWRHSYLKRFNEQRERELVRGCSFGRNKRILWMFNQKTRGRADKLSHL